MDDESRKLLGARIKSQREENRLSQEILAEKLGMKRTNVANYEAGRVMPPGHILSALSKIFGVSTDYLLTGFDIGALVTLVNYVRDSRSYEQFAADTGIDENQLFEICTGFITEQPPLDVIHKIADNNPIDFIVDRKDLLEAAGYWAEAKKYSDEKPSFPRFSYPNPPSAIELDSNYLRRIPLVGQVAAGDPILAIENIGEYIIVDTRINRINDNAINDYFALEITGQSMEPTIHDGEIVLVRRQPVIDPGEIGVFRCNQDEATIKRFVREAGRIYLIPDNKQFPVQEYTEDCVCIGKVIESIRRAIK